VTAIDELQTRIAGWEQNLGSFSLERLNATKRIEEIDRNMKTIEGAISAARLAIADIQQEINQSQKSIEPTPEAN
jgi:peptidoglycan hydrolase CwlO-like protein